MTVLRVTMKTKKVRTEEGDASVAPTMLREITLHFIDPPADFP
jgi:hypothetical protein